MAHNQAFEFSCSGTSHACMTICRRYHTRGEIQLTRNCVTPPGGVEGLTRLEFLYQGS
jgi:hypothetical protein